LKKPIEISLLQALSGKTSGVNITRNSGDPSVSAYIQIRGQKTLLGDSSHLVVIDGAIVSNSSIDGGTGGVDKKISFKRYKPIRYRIYFST
jgi:hypothetical protein